LKRLVLTALVWGAAHTLAYAQVTLNFVNADIDQVAKTIGAATNKTIIVDPRVKGQINIVSEQPVDKEIAFKTLESTLRMQGYALVEDHGIYKVVPEAEAKLQGVPTVAGNTPQLRGDQVITQVFRLQNESANNVLPVLRPLIAPNNTITAYPANNTLVVTDYADNVRRIAAIIASIDGENGATVDIVPVKNANASDVAALVQKTLDPNSVGGNDASLRILVTPDSRTNSIVLRSNSNARLEVARALIAKLDEPGHSSGNMHVVHLKNADATKLAQTLRGMLGLGGGAGGAASSTGAGGLSGSNSGGGLSGNSTSTGTAGLPPLPQGGASGASSSGSSAGLGNGGPSFASSESESQNSGGGGVITADAATNSLIITAPEPIYRNLQNVIDQLDARRAQVYIESLIIEVSDDKSAQLGVQWQGVVSNKANNTGLFAGTNFGTGGSNIIDLTAAGYAGSAGLASALPPAGLNVGLLHKFNNLLGIGGLVQALESLSGVNVLSTPNLITLDNEEAKIVIGQNVPFITGSYAQTGTAATVTPFQTYEREDVGITLRVKPQITQGGGVKLQIYQESSSVVPNTDNNPGGVTTNKRSIQSTVLCDDSEIIVLGGLIQDSYSESNSKVPWLGDLPVLGPLFRSESKDHSKTNLMVFLRPVVVRDSATTAAISQNRYDLMRGMGQNYQSGNRVIRDNNTPVAPPVTPADGGDGHLAPVPRQEGGGVPAPAGAPAQ
jgi:general secretion pathway protein D